MCLMVCPSATRDVRMTTWIASTSSAAKEMSRSAFNAPLFLLNAYKGAKVDQKL